MNYHTSSHSKYLIKLHFVIVVKYRRKLLVGKFNDEVLQIVFEICKENNYIIDEMQSDKNHLHILLDLAPKFSPKEVISKIKQVSTFRIYKNNKNYLRRYFWKENTLWSDGYFVCSTGDASTETIKKYIKEQG